MGSMPAKNKRGGFRSAPPPRIVPSREHGGKRKGHPSKPGSRREAQRAAQRAGKEDSTMTEARKDALLRRIESAALDVLASAARMRAGGGLDDARILFEAACDAHGDALELALGEEAS